MAGRVRAPGNESAANPGPALVEDPDLALAIVNERRALRLTMLVTTPVLVVLGVGCGIGVSWWAGVAAGLVGWVASSWWLRQRSLGRLLSALGVSSASDALDPYHAARLLNIVDGLSSTAGVGGIETMILESRAIDALALAQPAGGAVIVVTSAAATELDLVALEALVAHEVAHVRRGEALLLSVAGSTLGWVAGRRAPGGRRRSVAMMAMDHLMGSHSQIEADRLAVRFTRYPPGLVAVLERAAGAPALLGEPPLLGEPAMGAARRRAILATAPGWQIFPAVDPHRGSREGGRTESGSSLGMTPELRLRVDALEEY